MSEIPKRLFGSLASRLRFVGSRQPSQLQEAALREIDARNKLADANKLTARYHEQLTASEAREANARNMLLDANRLLAECQEQLTASEAREANGQNILIDTKSLVAKYQQELAASEARETDARNRLAAVEQQERERLAAQSGLASAPDTPLEALLAEYGLTELAQLIKTRRVSDEYRHAKRAGGDRDVRDDAG